MKLFLLSLLGGLSFALYSYTIKHKTETTVTEKRYLSEYVYVVIIDGPRFTETFGDTSCRYIPHMGKELVKEGVLLSDFRNNGHTYTIAGHTAILTGVYQKMNNGGTELPKNPSLFQYYLKEKGVDRTDAWIVASKGKLEVLGNTNSKKWWNVYMPYTYCGPQGNSSSYGPDEPTLDKMFSLIQSENPPHLMLVNFLAVDSYGHSNEWEKYLESLQRLDGFVDQIWKKIQSTPKLKDKTSLIITNDHGRHLDGHKNGFVNHGDGCEGCRHIAFLGLGPDFKKGVKIEHYGEQIDISATIADMLHFKMPTTKGKVLTQIFNH